MVIMSSTVLSREGGDGDGLGRTPEEGAVTRGGSRRGAGGVGLGGALLSCRYASDALRISSNLVSSVPNLMRRRTLRDSRSCRVYWSCPSSLLSLLVIWLKGGLP